MTPGSKNPEIPGDCCASSFVVVSSKYRAKPFPFAPCYLGRVPDEVLPGVAHDEFTGIHWREDLRDPLAWDPSVRAWPRQMMTIGRWESSEACSEHSLSQ